MADCLDNITGSRFALCPYHGRSLAYPAESLTQVPRSAYERYFEHSLVYVVDVICRAQNFALVNVVDLDRFKDLGYGLRLVAQGSDRKVFIVNAAFVDDPDREVSRMILENYRGGTGAG